VGYEKHLLVDGSNILHAWPELRVLLKRDRDSARTRLSQMLTVIHDAEQIQTTLVFDGRGAELVVEYPNDIKTFRHIFTPSGTTADDVIEQLVGQTVAPSTCIVATDDRAERQTIEASGAASISAEELASWVERAERRQRTQITSLLKENKKNWQQKGNK
jgi:predicted RNA-binding protein with PIN domain